MINMKPLKHFQKNVFTIDEFIAKETDAGNITKELLVKKRNK